VGIYPLGEGFLLHGFSLICGGNIGLFLSFKYDVLVSKQQLSGWGMGTPERRQVRSGEEKEKMAKRKTRNLNSWEMKKSE
jgi:hypothetical protein